MVRTTFGPTGNRIQIVEADTGLDSDEAGQPTIIDDHEGTVPNFTVLDGDGDGQDGGETGDDSANGVRQSHYTNPENATISTRTGKPKRKYTRKSTTNTASAPGTPSADTAAKTAVITGHLEKVLYSLHLVASRLLNAPALEKSETDCALLAEAVKDIAAAHNFEKAIDPKTLAWIQFVFVVVLVYFGKDMVEWLFGKKTKASVTIMPPVSNFN